MTEGNIEIIEDVRARAFRIDLSMGEGEHETAEQPIDPDHDAANLAEMLGDAIRNAEPNDSGECDATLELDGGEDEDDTVIRVERRTGVDGYTVVDAAGTRTEHAGYRSLLGGAENAIRAWQQAHGLIERDGAPNA